MNRAYKAAIGLAIIVVMGFITLPREELTFVALLVSATVGLVFLVPAWIFGVLKEFADWLDMSGLWVRAEYYNRILTDWAAGIGGVITPYEQSFNDFFYGFLDIGKGVFDPLFGWAEYALAGIKGRVQWAANALDDLGEGRFADWLLPDIAQDALDWASDGLSMIPRGIEYFFWLLEVAAGQYIGLGIIHGFVYMTGLMFMLGALILVIRELVGMFSEGLITFGLALLWAIPQLLMRSVLAIIMTVVGFGLAVWALEPLIGSTLWGAVGIVLLVTGLLDSQGQWGSIGLGLMWMSFVSFLFSLGYGMSAVLVLIPIIGWTYLLAQRAFMYTSMEIENQGTDIV